MSSITTLLRLHRLNHAISRSISQRSHSNGSDQTTTCCRRGERNVLACIFILCRCLVLVLPYFAHTSDTGRSKRWIIFFRFYVGFFTLLVLLRIMLSSLESAGVRMVSKIRTFYSSLRYFLPRTLPLNPIFWHTFMMMTCDKKLLILFSWLA
jgi:hypothetical protein